MQKATFVVETFKMLFGKMIRQNCFKQDLLCEQLWAGSGFQFSKPRWQKHICGGFEREALIVSYEKHLFTMFVRVKSCGSYG